LLKVIYTEIRKLLIYFVKLSLNLYVSWIKKLCDYFIMGYKV
jgi:hypothetical protein